MAEGGGVGGGGASVLHGADNLSVGPGVVLRQPPLPKTDFDLKKRPICIFVSSQQLLETAEGAASDEAATVVAAAAA